MLSKFRDRLPFATSAIKSGRTDENSQSAPDWAATLQAMNNETDVRLTAREGGAAIPQNASGQASDAPIVRTEAEWQRDLLTARHRIEELESQLQRLERTLADPEKGQNAIVYYRLRAVWGLCHQQLNNLSRELRRKYEAPDLEAYRSRFLSDQQANLIALKAKISTLESEKQVVVEGIRKLENELTQLQGLFKKQQRQTLERAINRASEDLIPLNQDLDRLRAELKQAQDAKPPPYPGLSVHTKRAINAVLIALSQYFYLLFREDGIADMARTATRKPVSDVHFGLASDCLEIGMKVRELIAQARSDQERAERVRRRAEYLNTRLQYKNDNAAVPETDSVNSMPAKIQKGGNVLGSFSETVPVNVLAMNYWDLQEVLLR